MQKLIQALYQYSGMVHSRLFPSGVMDSMLSGVSKYIMKVKMKYLNNKTVTFKAEMVFKGHTQDETSYCKRSGQQQSSSVVRQCSAATLNL